MALVSLERARLHPAAADVSDEMLEFALTAASELIQKHCGQTFESQDEIIEVRNGTGINQIFLYELPVIEITECSVLEPDGTVVDIDPVDFRFDPDTGEVRFIDDPTDDHDYRDFTDGFRNWTFTYSAGYSVEVGSAPYPDLPEIIKECVINTALQLCEVSGTSNMLHLGSENAGDYRAGLRAVANSVGLSPTVKKALFDYLVPRVG